MRKNPIAIVTSGGGMKCAYSAGALTALAKKLGFTDPQIFVAASGSVGNMLYFIAGQYDAGEKCWTRYLPSSKFIRYFPFPKVRIDYLVDTIFRKYLPLDVERLQASKTRWFAPVTDVETGETRFISNDMWLDPYEVMRAAKSIPLLYDGHARLGNHRVLDGDLTVDIAELIQHAIGLGAKRILCVTNVVPRTKISKGIVRTRAYFAGPVLRNIFLKSIEPEEVFEIPEGVDIVTVSPTCPLPVSLFTRNRRKVIEAFRMGYDDTMAKKDEIAELLA